MHLEDGVGDNLKHIDMISDTVPEHITHLMGNDFASGYITTISGIIKILSPEENGLFSRLSHNIQFTLLEGIQTALEQIEQHILVLLYYKESDYSGKRNDTPALHMTQKDIKRFASVIWLLHQFINKVQDKKTYILDTFYPQYKLNVEAEKETTNIENPLLNYIEDIDEVKENIVQLLQKKELSLAYHLIWGSKYVAQQDIFFGVNKELPDTEHIKQVIFNDIDDIKRYRKEYRENVFKVIGVIGIDEDTFARSTSLHPDFQGTKKVLIQILNSAPPPGMGQEGELN